MVQLKCKSDEFLSQDKQRCCDRCPAGKHIRSECNGTKKTDCNDCVWGYYTATSNSLLHCKGCRVCHSINKHKILTECTATKNTQCECLPGFYCNEPDCELCRAVTICPEGKGVKVKASRTNDTICAVCENGTYSNVSDFHSPCLSHTRCEDFGRKLKTPGSSIADAECGTFISQCPWILPASLWAGMVLMSLILLGILCWRAKRKCYKTAFSSVKDVPVELLPPFPACPVELPFPSTQWNGHCQESCEEMGCETTRFDSDDKVISFCTQDSMESSLPRTPLKATVQFAETNHVNGNARNCTRNSLLAHSEPQEDEWCGT